MFMWQITRLKSTYKTEKQTIMSSQDKKMWKQNRNRELLHVLCEATRSRNDRKNTIKTTIGNKLQYKALQKMREKYLVQQRR